MINFLFAHSHCMNINSRLLNSKFQNHFELSSKSLVYNFVVSKIRKVFFEKFVLLMIVFC